MLKEDYLYFDSRENRLDYRFSPIESKTFQGMDWERGKRVFLRDILIYFYSALDGSFRENRSAVKPIQRMHRVETVDFLHLIFKS